MSGLLQYPTSTMATKKAFLLVLVFVTTAVHGAAGQYEAYEYDYDYGDQNYHYNDNYYNNNNKVKQLSSSEGVGLDGGSGNGKDNDGPVIGASAHAVGGTLNKGELHIHTLMMMMMFLALMNTL